MLRAGFAVALLLSANAFAQTLPKLEPLPEPPPMPAEGAFEPQVTIVKRGQDTTEEFRLQGRLYMIKVTPPHGKPYYLVDNRGDGHFAREEPLDSGLRVPMWVIKEF